MPHCKDQDSYWSNYSLKTSKIMENDVDCVKKISEAYLVANKMVITKEKSKIIFGNFQRNDQILFFMKNFENSWKISWIVIEVQESMKPERCMLKNIWFHYKLLCFVIFFLNNMFCSENRSVFQCFARKDNVKRENLSPEKHTMNLLYLTGLWTLEKTSK